MESINLITERNKIISSFLDEKSKRLYYATESKVLGHGGIGIVSKATGVSRTTISTGLKELENFNDIPYNMMYMRKVDLTRTYTPLYYEPKYRVHNYDIYTVGFYGDSWGRSSIGDLDEFSWHRNKKVSDYSSFQIAVMDASGNWVVYSIDNPFYSR